MTVRNAWSARGYGLAAAFVAAAYGCTLLIQSDFSSAPMRFFFAAVVASAWFGGQGPSWFAILLSTLTVNFFFDPPATFLIEFLAFSIGAGWLTSRGKRAEDDLKRAHDLLEARVAERTAALTETNRQLRDEMTERRRAEEAYQQAHADLAHVTRVMSMGEMTASIAHEVNQPLSGVMINANAGLRWLGAESPNLEEARLAIQRIIRDGRRAGDVITRIRALSKKTSTAREPLNINEAIEEIVALAQGEARRQAVSIRLDLTRTLPLVTGDRVQLQQVVLNLVMNGIDAMSTIGGRSRELVITTDEDGEGRVRVSVRDAGIGLDPENLERLFDAFYTTKRAGLGIGLSISRSIVTSHGGQLWAAQNDGPGATFLFTIPTDSASQVAT